MDGFAGAIGVSESDGKCSPEYIVCDPLRPDTIPEYYAPCLREMSRQGFIEVSCKAVRERAPRIRFSTFGEMWLPVPPREEQIEIAAYVKESRRRYDEHLRTLRSSVGTLREYRTALISAAVTGKIDVREEVASNGHL
jgi:type I restriction enzyme S subunit